MEKPTSNIDITISIPAHIVARIRTALIDSGTPQRSLTALSEITSEIIPAVVEAIVRMPAQGPADGGNTTIQDTAPPAYTPSDPARAASSSVVPKAVPVDKQVPVGQRYEIEIKSLLGEAFTITVDDSYTIDDVKSLISLQEDGLAPDAQRLIYAGRQLEDGRTLLEVSWLFRVSNPRANLCLKYGIGAGKTLHLVGRLRGT